MAFFVYKKFYSYISSMFELSDFDIVGYDSGGQLQLARETSVFVSFLHNF